MRGGKCCKVLILALASCVVLAGWPGATPAYACSCASAGPVEKLERSDAVFTGTVSSVSGDAADPFSLGGVTFEVRDVYKGEASERIEAYGYGPGASCGVEFVEGESDLVYASRDEDGSLSTGLCEGTVRLTDAQRDLAVLNSTVVPETGGMDLSRLAALLAGALLASVGGVAIQKRRTR